MINNEMITCLHIIKPSNYAFWIKLVPYENKETKDTVIIPVSLQEQNGSSLRIQVSVLFTIVHFIIFPSRLSEKPETFWQDEFGLFYHSLFPSAINSFIKFANDVITNDEL